MNITDYIVECLQQGKTVEIPGVGTWKSIIENAHFDEASATFYPTQTVVNFDARTAGNEEFINYIAATECISADVAKQMVKNYSEVLSEKLAKEGKVTIGELGDIQIQEGSKSFATKVLSSEDTVPLAGIKTYKNETNEDPFAIFDPVKRAEAAARKKQAEAETERLSGVANIVGGTDILKGNETVELTPQEVRERERLVKEEMKRIKQEERDKEREARESAIREQDDAKRAEGDVLPEDIEKQAKAEKEALKEKARLEKEEMEARKAEERREKEEQKAREKAEKEEQEAKARAEKEAQKARERQEKEELEAKKAEEKREKEELKAKEKAEKEAAEAREKAEKEAQKEKERLEKEEREAKAKADKEALKEKERLEKEEREAKAKAEKEAQKEKERLEREEREARYRAEKEAQIEKEKQEKAEREALRAKEIADKEANKAKELAEKDAAKAKAKADKEALKEKEMKEKADKKAKKKADKEAKEAMKRQKKEERKAAKESKKQAAVADPLAVPEVSFGAKEEKEGKKDKKKGKAWLWILIVLLLLLLACAAAVYFGKPDFAKPAHDWFFTNVMKQEQKETAELDIDNMVTNSGEQTSSSTSQATVTPSTGMAAEAYGDACLFSFNEQLTDFSPSDIECRADAINDYVSGYITQYLNEKHYSTAKVPMMERIRQYTVSRLIELYDNSGYSEERFFASGDYVSEYLTEYKKAHKGRQKQVMVQSEIMDRSFLDNMLNTMVDEIGLKADNAKVAMPPAPPAPPVIKTEKKSRQGFDLIAGFYTNATTAQKMVDRLKGYGCAAYIIEINHGYYVSMGSAATRTQAEEKYRKAKEWYDGDLSIKSF
ncbi:MAG: hypothetical protein J5711_03730 [Bacteroidales bacterium]|nr:hypothetical protein [Bacteroidales bacterium]